MKGQAEKAAISPDLSTSKELDHLPWVLLVVFGLLGLMLGPVIQGGDRLRPVYPLGCSKRFFYALRRKHRLVGLCS